MKNKLIVFEGIDGVGKTTISKKIQKTLLRMGIPAVRYEDCEKKSEGFNLIKPFIHKETSVDSSLFFFIASAIFKSQKIKMMLRDNWVICDRYIYSTLANHQVRGANLKLIPPLEKLPIILPDFYFVLKVDEKVRIKRLKTKKDSIASDFRPNIRGSYFYAIERYFMKYKPIILDNSELKTDTVVKQIVEIIKPVARKRRSE